MLVFANTSTIFSAFFYIRHVENHLSFPNMLLCCPDPKDCFAMRIFEIAGDSNISPSWPAGALRISAFSLLWTVSLVLVILFHFLFCSSCGTMELGWVQQLLLFAPVGCSGQWSRGKEEGGIGERQTCTGRISVTCSEQINSATTNDGEEKKRKRKMGKINKTD